MFRYIGVNAFYGGESRLHIHIFNKQREILLSPPPSRPLLSSRFSALAKRSGDRLVYLAPISRRAMYLWACEKRIGSLSLADLVIVHLSCKRPLARNRAARVRKVQKTCDREILIHFFLHPPPRIEAEGFRLKYLRRVNRVDSESRVPQLLSVASHEINLGLRNKGINKDK